MNHYFIDYENVRWEGLKGIEDLDRDNYVYIFYTVNSNTLTFEAMNNINKSQAYVAKIKVEAGSKNALDFQLSSFLGYKINGNTEDQFIIVSKDKGFKPVKDFWERSNIRVLQKISIQDSFPSDEENELDAVLNQYPAEVKHALLTSTSKVEFNNNLVKLYGSEKGGQTYQSLKKYIKQG